MRDKFKRQGMSSKAAKGKAARIYNSKHPDEPVGPNYEKDKKAKKRRKPKVRYPE
jgi:hypothetical protein